LSCTPLGQNNHLVFPTKMTQAVSKREQSPYRLARLNTAKALRNLSAAASIIVAALAHALDIDSMGVKRVHFTLFNEDTNETLTLRIPKAYLVNHSSWSDGGQHIIMVKAHLPDLVAWSEYTRQLETGEGAAKEEPAGLTNGLLVQIWDRARRVSDGPARYTEWMTRNRKLGPENVVGLQHFRRVCYKDVRAADGSATKTERLCPAFNEDHFLKPLNDPGPFVSIVCPRSAAGPAQGCEATTTHRGWAIKYLFARSKIHNWKEIDGAARRLFDQFAEK
jgi:hypothetical protein